MTNFNTYLSEFSDFVSITSEKDKFINEIKNQIKNPRSSDELRNFAKNHDWSNISAKYYDLIKRQSKKIIN